jgi:hypothetical protein
MSSDQTSTIYALNVNLFAFSLQSGVNADTQKTINVTPEIFKQKYEQLIQNYADTFGSINPLPELRKEFPASHQYELLNANKQGRQFHSFASQTQNPLALKPLYRLILYPQKISDSYALLINVFRPQSAGFDAVSLDEIPTFNPNQCLRWGNDENLIGETYLITAFLAEAKPSHPEALKLPAEEILKKLFNDRCPDFYQADKFLDSYILEFGSPKRSQTRYLVLFYFAESTCDRFKNIYWDLPELFLYYHKITHVFQMSRQYAEQLDKLISEKIESQLPSFDNTNPPSETLDLEDLKTKLKTLLKTAPKYTWELRQLENALNTIEINTGNYQRTLKRLQNQVGDRLDLFHQFARRESKTFQLQIQADLNYAKPGSQLLDQAIASIRGIVEIEQVESDRSLERTIEILAAGLGAGGIVASAVSGHIDKPLVIKIPQAGDRIHPGVSSLLFSFLFALVLGGVVGLINGKFRVNGTIAKIFNYILGHSK